jgi:hypothetical protein
VKSESLVIVEVRRFRQFHVAQVADDRNAADHFTVFVVSR